MADFPLYDIDNAPEPSKQHLEQIEKTLGFAPNIYKVMAGAPPLLDVYMATNKAFQKTSFSTDEQTIVWQTVNLEHECHYCVPAHSSAAHMMGVDPILIDALRKKEPIDNPKLEALRTFVLAMVRKRGQLSDVEMEAFFAAGYGQQQVLEVILGIAHKLMSNYTNHVAQTPKDPAFAKFD